MRTRAHVGEIKHSSKMLLMHCVDLLIRASKTPACRRPTHPAYDGQCHLGLWQCRRPTEIRTGPTQTASPTHYTGPLTLQTPWASPLRAAQTRPTRGTWRMTCHGRDAPARARRRASTTGSIPCSPPPDARRLRRLMTMEGGSGAMVLL